MTIFVIGLMALPLFAQKKENAGKKVTQQWVNIDELRPTQAVVGFIEVDAKVKYYQSMSHKERRKFSLGKPAQVVKAPDGQFYVIDGHHTTRALQLTGESQVAVKLVEDYSHLKDMEKFWKRLQSQSWTYLKNDQGTDIRPSDLPRHFLQLQDDPYRSLSWFVRKADGFENLRVPFQEFYWANYFRERVKFDPKDPKSFAKAVEEATELAGSREARGLAGFIPSPSKKKARKSRKACLVNALKMIPGL